MSKKSYYEVCSCSVGWYQPDWRDWIHPVTGVKHRSLKRAWESYARCRRGKRSPTGHVLRRTATADRRHECRDGLR